MDRLPVFMGEVPEYRVIGDHMHILYGSALEVVLPISVMLAGLASAEAAIAKWQLVQLEKKPIPISRRR